MDVRRLQPYVARVRLLLLLSALLSALTGAQAAARVTQPVFTVEQAGAVSAAARVQATRAPTRPGLALPGLAENGPIALPASWRLAQPVPLYLSRSRE